MNVRLWIDVEDLFEYRRANPRPSGIQRLAFELCRALHEHDNGSGYVRFVRHDTLRNDLRTIPWADVAALFENLVTLPREPPARTQSVTPRGRMGNALREFVYRLPPEFRVTLLSAFHDQRKAFSAWVALGRAIAASGRSAAVAMYQAVGRLPARRSVHTDRSSADETLGSREFATLAANGDVLLVTGAPWFDPNFSVLVDTQRKRRGLRLGLLVYDIIPIRCPEWCDPGLVRLFRSWFDRMLPLCDYLFAISKYTAGDLEAYAKEIEVNLARRVVPIPIGTGLFGAPVRTERLPAPETYALYVSTMEARKNHLLLFRVWRRLLQSKSPDAVPKLVFAGRVGWLVSDLMQQIANTDNLNGKLVVVEDPTDSELATLYQGCMFTVFPSLYEGWGLPVTESLTFGKPCLIADRTSLPEAGGHLVRSFNPDNLDDAYAAIRGAIENGAELEEWAAKIRRDFKPVPWSAAAEALLAALDVHPMCAAGTAERQPATPHADNTTAVPWYDDAIGVARRAAGAN